MNQRPHQPLLRPRTIVVAALAAALLLWLASQTAQAQTRGTDDPAPGFGFTYGEGQTEEGGRIVRIGVSTRRIQDDDRIGSLGLVYQEFHDGLNFDKLDTRILDEDIELRSRSIYAELKRYFPLNDSFMLYWGLRGGYTRLDGRVKHIGPDDKFEESQVAPLWFLAVPFVLEHPGFLLMALVDGSSVGLTFDVFKDQVWLDLSVGGAVLPELHTRDVVLEDRYVLTGVLQLAVVF